MDDKHKLRQPTTPHHSQLRAEMTNLEGACGELCVAYRPQQRELPTSFQEGTCEHVWDRVCKAKLLTTKGAKQEDPSKACSTNACKQDKQQQLEQQAKRSKNNLRNKLEQA